jgi:DNA-binding transcriptional LysR family regulator
MNYTLHQLHVFLKITQTRSITKAAEELHLSQPAVSIQLRNFQEQFDIPLTEVIGRKIYITDFGQEIARAAEKILAEVEAIHYKAMNYKGLLSGKLRISVVSTGKYVMPYFLSDFVHRNQGIELLLEVSNRKQVLTALENNETDFAFVTILPEQLSVERIELMENKLYLVGASIPDAEPPVARLDLLKQIPLIYREKGSGTRYMMEKFIKDNQAEVRKKMELNSNEAVKHALIAGLGYSIMPLISIKNEIANGELRIIPMEGLPLISAWNLIWLSSKQLTPVAKAFLQYLQLHRSYIIQQNFNWYERYQV